MTQKFSIPSLHPGIIALAASIAISGLLVPIQSIAAGAAESGDHNSYVLLSAGSQSSTMSGSTDDLRRARALRSGREGLLYVRQAGAAYVIRDAATLRRAEELFAPQQELGARQAELGSRQAALGSRQAALGAEQARLAARQAGASAGRADSFERQQSDLGARQDALGRQQDALGSEQDSLGREQDRLGRQADARLRALVAEAIQRGLAQRTN